MVLARWLFPISQNFRTNDCCLTVSSSGATRWSTCGSSEIIFLSRKELQRLSLLASSSFTSVIGCAFSGAIFGLPFLPYKSESQLPVFLTTAISTFIFCPFSPKLHQSFLLPNHEVHKSSVHFFFLFSSKVHKGFQVLINIIYWSFSKQTNQICHLC